MFSSDVQDGLLSFHNPNLPDECLIDRGNLRIDIKVDDGVAHQFLVGLHSESFDLAPGASVERQFDLRTFSEDELRKIPADRLYGVKVKVEIRENDGSGKWILRPESAPAFYVYGYLDNSDDDSADSQLKLADTVIDPQQSVVRTRLVNYVGDPQAVPSDLSPAQLKKPGEFAFTYAPDLAGNFAQPLLLTTPEGDSVTTPAELTVVASATEPIKVHLDRALLRGDTG